MAPKINPLNALVAPAPVSFAADFRLRPMPKLAESMVQGASLASIFNNHDQAMEEWKRDAERSINERITQATNIPLGTKTTTATTAAATASTPSTPAAAPVLSVNGKTGDVILSTDDVSDTPTHPYLTSAGWMTLFDHLGFVRNIIPLTDVVHIPLGRSGVVPGSLTINGLLVVDGILAILPVPDLDIEPAGSTDDPAEIALNFDLLLLGS